MHLRGKLSELLSSFAVRTILCAGKTVTYGSIDVNGLIAPVQLILHGTIYSRFDRMVGQAGVVTMVKEGLQ